jgi:hypothetical protein
MVDVYNQSKNATEIVLNQKKICFKTLARDKTSFRFACKPLIQKTLV